MATGWDLSLDLLNFGPTILVLSESREMDNLGNKFCLLSIPRDFECLLVRCECRHGAAEPQNADRLRSDAFGGTEIRDGLVQFQEIVIPD